MSRAITVKSGSTCSSFSCTLNAFSRWRKRLRTASADITLRQCVGPSSKGAFVGLMVASSLRLPFSYSEPVRDHRAAGLFPVSYPIPKPLEPELKGKRVAIVNDVINAGSAVRGTLTALRQCGAQPVAIGTLAVYGLAASELAATHGVALEALASFPSRIWEPSACPLCAKGVPLNA